MCQPVDRFELELPDEAYAPVASLLSRLEGTTHETVASDGFLRLVGHLPSSAVTGLASRLPDLTSGEGVLVSRLDHHAPVTAHRPPSRRRTGPDPRDRTTWFRHLPR